MPGPSLLERYLVLGLRTGRHIDGFVDAYYGPAGLAARVAAEDRRAPAALVAEARAVLAELDAGEPIGSLAPPNAPAEGDEAAEPSSRRAWLRAQLVGVLTSCRILAGEHIGYADEVEACYGVRPQRVPEERIVSAHRALDEVVPGTGPLAERMIAWREAQAVPPRLVERAVRSLAEELRERTASLFGLPGGERLELELVHGKPWSGFNYYLGELTSRVAINLDLPVLATSIGNLVAHEAYPGHHTEHCRKEVGLVRRRRFFEESIFLVGTPQCLLAEGLADLGLEVVAGPRPEPVVAAHLRPLGVPYDADTAAVVAEANEVLAATRANAAFRLHEDGADPDGVVDELAAAALTTRQRAAKSVQFLLDATWRAYVSCYIEGMPLCRRFVGGDPGRFARLISEQLTPADLLAAPGVRPEPDPAQRPQARR
jgi:hypothetical protein